MNVSLVRRCGLAFGLALTLVPPAGADQAPGSVARWQLIVTETAGIRRFGYPVSVILPLTQGVQPGEHPRLLEDGRPIPAQFRVDQSRDKKPVLYLDFNVNHAPFEKRTYRIEQGPSIPPGPEPKGGLTVEAGREAFTVAHSSGLAFEIPRDLLGLLHQVRAGSTEYLRPGSPGLFIRYKDHIDFRAGGFGPYGVPTTARVTRSGPLAAALRFESTEGLRGNRQVASVVEMEFPRSKSWVKVTWTIDDPQGLVAGLGAELWLNSKGEPTLVDFGAGSLVYAPLRKGERAVLRAWSLAGPNGEDRSGWETFLGPASSPKAYVVAPPDRHLRAEGWAHVMDRERCTALAVQGFADRGQGELIVDADGRLHVWRSFALGEEPVPQGTKTLTFWLHFVGMPVHVGAATSPQAMLAPLHVEVRAEASDKP